MSWQGKFVITANQMYRTHSLQKIQPWNVAWFLTTWPSIDALFG
jgi:hypothetical protein